MMEKAKTASSTSHSSEIRWREEPHPPKLTSARALSLSHGLSSRPRPLCSWSWEPQWQWQIALVFSSRRNTEVIGAGPGGAVGAARRCRRQQQGVPHPSNDSW